MNSLISTFKVAPRGVSSWKSLVLSRAGAMTFFACMAMVAAVLFTYHCLGRTFCPIDEGWYMYLQKNIITDQIWRGHLLFSHWRLLDDLYYNRLAQFVISLVSWGTFAFGVSSWMRRFVSGQVNFLLVFGLTFLLQVKMEQTFVCNYMLIAPAFCAAALGWMFLAISSGRLSLLSLTGILMALVVPQKITSLALFPAMMAAIWIVDSRHRQSFAWLLGGFVAGLIGYFTIVESPSTISKWLGTGFYELSTGEGNHGYQVLFMWLRDTAFQYLKWLFLAVIILVIPWIYRREGWLVQKPKIRLATQLTAIAVAIYFFRVNVSPHIPRGDYFFVFQNLVITLSFIVVICCWPMMRKEVRALLALLLIAPALVCFGTDVPFYHFNGVLRMIPPVMAMIVLIKGARGHLLAASAVSLCILAVVAVVAPPKPHKSYWGDKLSEQTVNLGTVCPGQNVLVDPEYVNLVQFFQREVPKGSEVLARTRYWSTIYLLDLKPMSNTYRTQHATAIANAKSVVEAGRKLYVMTFDPGRNTVIGPIDAFVEEMKENGHTVEMKTNAEHRLFIIH